MSTPLHSDPASPPYDRTSLPPVEEPIDPVLTEDMLRAFAVALPSPGLDSAEQKERRRIAAFMALRSFDAQGPAEAMLATHAVLAHHFAMECYRRAALSSRTSDLDIELLGTAAMLSRTMDGMLNTLEARQDEPLWVGSPGNA
jgi:hypothetical protein